MTSFKRSAKLEEKLRIIKQHFMEQLLTRTARIAMLHEVLIRGEADKDQLDELKLQAHSLAGGGGTFGFDDITKAGRDLEDALHRNSDKTHEDIAKLTAALLVTCEKALAPEEEAGKQPPLDIDALREKREQGLPLILVLGQCADTRHMMSSLFADVAALLFAATVHEVEEQINTFRPQIVLLNGGKASDSDMLKQISAFVSRAGCAETPMIMLADNPPDEAAKAVIAAHNIEYIEKPYIPAAVAKIIIENLKLPNKLIMIADDDKAICYLLKEYLEEYGYQTITVNTGNEAWVHLQSNPISLLILDRTMPGYDGMTLLGMMKESASLKNIPVILLTARDYGSDVLDGLKTGASEYITKPFNIEFVIRRCRELLAESEKAAQAESM
ncbi:MAG: response regulator [Alphaproteobacteria bacterium]|nr:response regulator [Alphaproteobacteria bacterium]